MKTMGESVEALSLACITHLVSGQRTWFVRSDVNVKVERGSTFTFTRGFSYIVSILFTHVKPVKVCVRTHVKITRQWKSTFTLSL